MNNESLLEIIFEKASQNNIPIVVIGGLALPAYKVGRTTLDIDISLNYQHLKELDS
ncbi:MAG: hypothetical protein GF353_06755, partial [Candidatus Lokiarchaeota archaeon]|nr:hypothetical protein [Candidatus Lokiarchaeota archaeon]